MTCALTGSVTALPLFLVQLGVEGTVALAGWYATAYGAGVLVSFLVMPLWGALGDRVGRRRMLLRAALGFVVAQALFFACRTPLEVVGVRVFQGAVSGVIPALYAFAAGRSGRDGLGQVLGVLESVAAAASIAGPFSVPLLVGLGGTRLVYAAGGVLGLVGSAAIYWGLRGPDADATAPGQGVGLRRQIVQVTGYPGVRPLLSGMAAFSAVQGLLERLFPIFIFELAQGEQARATLLAAAKGVGEGTRLLLGPALGKAVDRFGVGPVLRTCLAVAGASTVAVPWARGPASLLALIAVSEGAASGVRPGIYSGLTQVVPFERVGTAISLGGSALRGGVTVGVAVAGPAVAWLGLPGAFALAAVGFGVVAAWAPWRRAAGALGAAEVHE
jgi:MFS family permease